MKANQEDEPFDPIDGPRRLESQRICLAGEFCGEDNRFRSAANERSSVGEKIQTPRAHLVATSSRIAGPGSDCFPDGRCRSRRREGFARLGLLRTGWWSFKGTLQDTGASGDNMSLRLPLTMSISPETP
jgi:hypothetical protein